jgi:hypothetical protein
LKLLTAHPFSTPGITAAVLAGIHIHAGISGGKCTAKKQLNSTGCVPCPFGPKRPLVGSKKITREETDEIESIE